MSATQWLPGFSHSRSSLVTRETALIIGNYQESYLPPCFPQKTINLVPSFPSLGTASRCKFKHRGLIATGVRWRPGWPAMQAMQLQRTEYGVRSTEYVFGNWAFLSLFFPKAAGGPSPSTEGEAGAGRWLGWLSIPSRMAPVAIGRSANRATGATGGGQP